MTDNVTRFPGPQPEILRILACECGCLSFRIDETGEASCSACETYIDGETAGWIDPGGIGDAKSDADLFTDHRFGAADLARAQTIRRAEDPEAVFVGSLHRDGTITAWMDRAAVDRAEWAKQRLDEFKAAIDAWADTKP